jgi:hypothetical protein
VSQRRPHSGPPDTIFPDARSNQPQDNLLRAMTQNPEWNAFQPTRLHWLRDVTAASLNNGERVPDVDCGPGTHYSGIRGLVQLASGSLVSVAQEGVLRFWHPDTLRSDRAEHLPSSPKALLNIDGHRFVIAMVDCCILRTEDPRAPQRLLRHEAAAVRCTRVLPSGQIATADATDVIRVWDAADGSCVRTRQFSGLLTFFPVGPQHLLVVTADDSGSVSDSVWNIAADTCHDIGHRSANGAGSLALLSHGRWARTTPQGHILVFQADGSVLRSLDLEVRSAQILAWDADADAWSVQPRCAIASLPSGVLAVWGVRRTDHSAVLWLWDPDVGAARPVYTEPCRMGTIHCAPVVVDAQTLLLRYTLDGRGDMPLLVSTDPERAPQPCIAPLGTIAGYDIGRALRLHDGRIVTWSPRRDSAAQVWSSDGYWLEPLGAPVRSKLRNHDADHDPYMRVGV